MDHTKPLGGLGGLEMEVKGELFKFSSPFPIPIRPYLFSFDLIWAYSHASLQRAELGADYSSVRASVRACVPLLGEAQNICFCTILSEISENHLCILQYLAPVALKTYDKLIRFFVNCSKHTIK